jgi:NodT family efflux transporter outer membrane factor (OMF) lipoprotein
VLLLLSSGCAVGPDYSRPKVALNGAWSGKADPRLAARAVVDEAWWRTFRDPALDQLVELAARQNLPLQVAGIRIYEARAKLGVAVGQQWPTNPNPIASGVGGGIHEPANDGNAPFNLYFGAYTVGFDASWEIDIWGKYRRGVRAAKAAYFSTVAEYQDAQVSLTAEVARTYILIRTYQVLLGIARENVAVQEDGLRIAESRYHNGATSGLDVDQATYLLENTRATIPGLQLSLTQSENALCTLLSRPTGCTARLLAGSETIPQAPATVAVGVPSELLRRRPDVRSAELAAVAQCDRIGVAKAELFPSLTLDSFLGTRTVTTNGSPSGVSPLLSIFNFGNFFYTFGAAIFWPLLSYPRILNNTRIEDARFQQTLLVYQNAVIKAAQEVEDGITGFVKEQEAVVSSEKAVAAAKDAVQLAVTQYREGAMDFQRVLDSQRALLTSQDDLARNQSAVVTNLVALYKALGGGWEPRRTLPAITDEIRREMQKRTNWGRIFSSQPPKADPR